MILYPLVKEWIEERRQRREADGRAIGEARGKAIGRELANREWVEWNNRRKAAEAAGENFTEPNPAEKCNGTSQNE